MLDGDLDLISWHAEELNGTHLSIAIAQGLDEPIEDWQYRAVASAFLWAKLRYPLEVLELVGHKDTEQGKRWGKQDPRGLDMDRLWRLIDES